MNFASLSCVGDLVGLAGAVRLVDLCNAGQAETA